MKILPLQCTFYFAYGANMSSQKLKNRLGSTSVGFEPAFVSQQGVYLTFTHRGGFANLARRPQIPSTDQNVIFSKPHGVLYAMTTSDLKQLAKHETGYVLSDIEVQTYEGKIVTAKAFLSKSSMTLKASVLPTKRYLGLLLGGAIEHGLAEEYVMWLRCMDCVDSDGLGFEYFDTPSILYTNISFFLVLTVLMLYTMQH